MSAAKNEVPNKRFTIGIIISAAFVIMGIACWVAQLTQGLHLTNLDNNNTWGLYIVGFVLFTGVAAGSLLFASSAWLFNGLAQFRPYTRIASFVGVIGSVIAAGLFIIVDIGNPSRIWYMITRFNFTSPIIWDTVILGSYVIIGIIFTRRLIQVSKGVTEEKSVKGIAIVAFIAGLLVTVTSFIFCIQVARPFWNNPVQPLSFLFAAVVVALALLLLVFAILRTKKYIAMSDELLNKMARVIAIFLAAELLVVLSEVALGLYAQSGEDVQLIHWLISGDGAVYFWVEIAAFALGMVLLLNRRTAFCMAGAGASFFAVLMVKYNLLQTQLLNPSISYPGLNGRSTYAGTAGNIAAGAYLPSWIEVSLSIGIVSLGVLLVLLGLKQLRLGDTVQQSPPQVDVQIQAKV